MSRARREEGRLAWKTAAEADNAGFEVLHRASDADACAALGFIPGAGATTRSQRYRYSVKHLTAGTHTFRLKQVDLDGVSTLTDETKLTIRVPCVVALYPNVPNPCVDRTEIGFTVASDGPARVEMCNVHGQHDDPVRQPRRCGQNPPPVGEQPRMVLGRILLHVSGEWSAQDGSDGCGAISPRLPAEHFAHPEVRCSRKECKTTANKRVSAMTVASSASMPHVEVGDARIPALGLGTWQNTGPQCTESVRMALNMGYRHVDTAQVYGNEAEVGEGIAAADVDRDDVFLTTKVWRSNLAPKDVHTSVRQSLFKLEVEAVDLLLIHWPHPLVPVEETLGAMEELRREGMVRHLGVSNFTASQLEAAIRVADSPLVTDQVLYHPYNDQSDLRTVCAENDVALTAYSPLGRGAVLSDDDLTEIGARYEKSAAQVALRWLVQQENVVAIPKATGRDHLAANIALFDFSLSDAEMARIHALRPSLGMRVQNFLPSIMRNLPFTPSP